jgi:hypothetical protein
LAPRAHGPAFEIASSMRLAWLVLLPSCVIVEKPSSAPPTDAPVMHDCNTGYTAHIYSPTDGSTQPAQFDAHYIWDQPDIPDRYISMSDLHGNYFVDNGSEQVQGDGSLVDHYSLPSSGSFVLEIGWICDGGNNGPEVPLARVAFTTAP